MASNVVVASPMVTYPAPPVEMAQPVASACCCNASIGNVISHEVIGEPIMMDSTPMIETMSVEAPMFDSVDYGTPLDAGLIVGEEPVMSAPVIVESETSLSDQGTTSGDSVAPAETAVESTPAEPVAQDPVAKDADSAVPPTPMPAEPKPADDTPVEPAPAEAKPADDTPADTAPADDLFGAPAAKDAAAPAAVDDLFGAPAAETPDAAAPAADPFGAPAAPSEAVPDAATDGAAAAMDDLFGGGEPAAAGSDAAPAKDAAPAADPFGAPSTPADQKAPAIDAGGLDDLFGGGEDAAPMGDAPAAAPAGDDPFGAPATPAGNDKAPAADADLDDLFGAPASDATPATTDSIDDLFGSAGNVATPENMIEELPAPIIDSVKETIAEKLATEEVSAKPLRLQVVSAPRVVSINPLSETRVRTWIDNTGQFRTAGRLIEITATHVRLLKSNGRTCTVPVDRMCPADSAYVKSLRKQVDDTRIALLTSK
ncbi:SHD1 domain-containing protein [Stieleria marina]|uniref:SHD1 domain-containing protein n=1 Tax=Stieleria marina TaxID=1930275 RepID=UPI003AF3BA00